MSLSAFLERTRQAGARPEHEAMLVRAWLHGQAVRFQKTNLRHPPARALVEILPEAEAELRGIAHVESEHPSSDGATRYLVALARGGLVECVLLARQTLCISTQLGCAVGCLFCKTGEGGLLRQLDVDEILAQVALVRERAPVRRVVLMGMGEPAHNLQAVLAALERLYEQAAISREHLVFSTVGEERALAALAAGSVRPTLALSLHTTEAAKRAELLPRAPRIAPERLVELAGDYARRAGLWCVVQWTLLAGVNDGEDEARRLIELVRPHRLMVNYIPFNAVEGSGFGRPSWERAVELVRLLKSAGVFATLRRSGAQEVDGGCGQLRARHLASPPRP